MKRISIIVSVSIVQYVIMLMLFGALVTPDIHFTPTMNVIYAIFYYITLFPLWLLISERLEPIWLFLSALGVYCLLYTSVLYTIISRIITVIRRKKSANSHTSPGE